ncbi:sensor histidine kinase [Antrihabitans stalactiti]|uniref:histidine kinase n=1 Tax=Antrihabitans stalactiti TaxID=2584121 RepID=A0A848KM80_9NOCA|nr:ATP-binding protein [Antrihabitans stalactiti]NMN99038.1 HAMP domain-containing protein [Antrihabitans stalactiti]
MITDSWNPMRWSVRAKSAVAAAFVVSVCFAVASGLLLLVLYRSLGTTAQDAATARADQIRVQLETDSPTEIDRSSLATDSQIGAVQIVDDTGAVLAASNGAPTRPLVTTSMSDGQVTDLGRVEDPEGNFDYWVSGRATAITGGTVTILVGADREPIESVVSRVAVLLAIGAPILLVVVVVSTYRLVGAALRPVEKIRARVAAISSTDLAQRVPVPAARDEIAHLATTMNLMLARLETGQAAQQRFVSDASHELRSPLATITTALDIAAGRPEMIDKELIDESLLPEARRMNQLIEDLLLLARSDENAVERQRIDVDLDDLLLAEAGRLRRIGSVQTVVHVEPCRVVGDPAALSRVIRNLVDNAARHASSTVELSCRPVADRAVISVSDDGPGIPPEERDRVFERFIRLDTARARASGGAGLGLSIVEQIVRMHDGTVAVTDAVGGGTVFSVTLPLGQQGWTDPS